MQDHYGFLCGNCHLSSVSHSCFQKHLKVLRILTKWIRQFCQNHILRNNLKQMKQFGNEIIVEMRHFCEHTVCFFSVYLSCIVGRGSGISWTPGDSKNRRRWSWKVLSGEDTKKLLKASIVEQKTTEGNCDRFENKWAIITLFLTIPQTGTVLSWKIDASREGCHQGGLPPRNDRQRQQNCGWWNFNWL